jgi:EpsD family peptidyl-prolyl cis-trans isomerase
MRKRIVFTLVVALAATACQKKPTGQSVAVVNGEEITASELNDALTNDNTLAGLDPKQARTAELQKLVDRKLIIQQAKENGLDKSPEFINQQRRGTEDLLINLLISRQANSQQLPSAAEIAKFEADRPGMFANREKWTLDQLNYSLPKDPSVTAKIAAAKSLDEVAQALTAAGIQYTKSTKQFDSAMLPPAIYAQLGKLQPGEPFVAPGPDRAVASVITAREPAPFTPDQARQVALAQIKRDQINKLLGQRIKDLKAKAKIEYQPGFAPPKN